MVTLVTQFATAVRTSELHRRIDSAADHRLTIINALDTLTGGA